MREAAGVMIKRLPPTANLRGAPPRRPPTPPLVALPNSRSYMHDGKTREGEPDAINDDEVEPGVEDQTAKIGESVEICAQIFPSLPFGRSDPPPLEKKKTGLLCFLSARMTIEAT